MYYVKYNEENGIEMLHAMPFDRQHGLNKTKEELETEGYLVEQHPVQENNGKKAELKFNVAKRELYYEYHDTENVLTDEERMKKLEKQNADLQMALMELAEAAEANEVKSQLAIMELAELIGGME